MTQRPHPRRRQPGIQRPQQLRHVAVSDGNTFGDTGGARRVDQVRNVIRRGRRQRRAGLSVNIGILDVDHNQIEPVQPRTQIRRRDRGDRRDIGEHELHTSRRYRRFDR